MSPVTIRDVAKYAGVGVGTVSRVMNDSPSVSDVTRKKVRAAIEELNYTPNPIARRLSLRKTLSIAAIVPFFTRPSVVKRLRGVMSVIAHTEYDFNVFSVETVSQREEHLKELPRRGRIDGLLIFSFPPHEAEVDQIIKADIPTVIIDSYHPRLNSIYIDNVDGGYQATQHLIELGHRKIGYLADPMDDPFGFHVSQDRFEGYQRALAKVNIAFNRNYLGEGPHSLEDARRLAQEILTQPDPPTAIFAFSDTIAMGVIEAARKLNLAVPGALSVIGFDNIEIAPFVGLSTIRQQLVETGIMGAQILLENLANPKQDPIHVLLPTELIFRQTTGPVPVPSTT